MEKDECKAAANFAACTYPKISEVIIWQIQVQKNEIIVLKYILHVVSTSRTPKYETNFAGMSK